MEAFTFGRRIWARNRNKARGKKQWASISRTSSSALAPVTNFQMCLRCWFSVEFNGSKAALPKEETNFHIERLEMSFPVALAFLATRPKELSCCLRHSCLYFAILPMTVGDWCSLVEKEQECWGLWPQNQGGSRFDMSTATPAQLWHRPALWDSTCSRNEGFQP